MTSRPAPAPDDAAALVAAQTWRCPSCHDTTAVMGMCQKCGVFGTRQEAAADPDDDAAIAARAALRLAALPAHPPAQPEPTCGVSLSCGLSPGHAGRHIDPGGVSWAYGLAIGAAPPAPLPLREALVAAYHEEPPWMDAGSSEASFSLLADRIAARMAPTAPLPLDLTRSDLEYLDIALGAGKGGRVLIHRDQIEARDRIWAMVKDALATPEPTEDRG